MANYLHLWNCLRQNISLSGVWKHIKLELENLCCIFFCFILIIPVMWISTYWSELYVYFFQRFIIISGLFFLFFLLIHIFQKVVWWCFVSAGFSCVCFEEGEVSVFRLFFISFWHMTSSYHIYGSEVGGWWGIICFYCVNLFVLLMYKSVIHIKADWLTD